MSFHTERPKKLMRASYPTDIGDIQWERISQLLPATASGGRPRDVAIREIVNAIRYIEQGGINWRMLPHDFPNWKTVYHYYRAWRRTGLWDEIQALLIPKRVPPYQVATTSVKQTNATAPALSADASNSPEQPAHSFIRSILRGH